MQDNKLTNSNLYQELIQLYQSKFGNPIESSSALTAHGSDREIIRLKDRKGSSAIGIFNESVSENRAFIEFGRHFRKQGLNVPEVFGISADSRFYLMEDLGDITLFNKRKEKPEFGENIIELYKKALRVLPEFQIKAAGGINYKLCYQFDEFGSENLEYDNEYFKQRFLVKFYKNELDSDSLNNDLGFLKSRILEKPRDYFLYRDFQSRNIMLKNDDLYFIDFQSGRKGYLLYDLASLLYDAKADIPQGIREELVDYYIIILGGYLSVDPMELKHYFWYFAIIRILQAMGAYGFLGFVKGKSKFLESVPYAIRNINFILNNRIDINELKYLRKIFGELLNEKA